MTDNADPNGQNPNGDEGQNPITGNEQNSAPTGLDALPPETQRELKTLRKEAEANRKRLAEYENANKTELERREAAVKAAEDRAAKLETRLRTMTAKSVVTDAASKANAISAGAVYALIRDGLEFDDDGEPTNVPALIAQAKKDEPALFRAANGSADGGKGGAPGTTANFNDVIREMARTAN